MSELDRSVVDDPALYERSVHRRRLKRELLSARSLSVVVLAAALPAAAAAAWLHGVDNGPWLIDHLWLPTGLVTGLVFGVRGASALADRAASRHAVAALRAALAAYWSDEARALAAWGAERGFVPPAAPPLTPADLTPLLRGPAEEGYANVLAGTLAGAPATFFHVTVRGPGGEDGPFFRWHTCTHLRRPTRTPGLVLTTGDEETCPLNAVAASIGEAWHDPTATSAVMADMTWRLSVNEKQELIGRMQARLGLSDQAGAALEAMTAATTKDERRIARDRLAAAVGGRFGLREAWQLMTHHRSRPVPLESVEFEAQYRLETDDPDDLTIVRLFSPATIVYLIGLAGPVHVELDDRNALFAVPSRLTDPAGLDAFLRRTADVAARLGVVQPPV